MKNILITGGAGFIGSNVCACLLENGYNVTVADDLKNAYVSHVHFLQEKFENLKFVKVDVCNLHEIENVFVSGNFDTVLHLSARKYVAESFDKKEEYFLNNMQSLENVLLLCRKYQVKHFAFASSITVYGICDCENICEKQKLSPASPYAETKMLGEEKIKDFAKQNPNMICTIFRFTNPVSASIKYMLGDHSKKHKINLVSFVCKNALENKPMKLNGNNHNTKDGTPVRDYIHVCDLAKIVCAVLEKQKSKFDTINVGCGKNGYSVLQVIECAEKVLNKKIEYSFGEKKKGDLAKIVCDNTHLINEYGNFEFKSLEQIVSDEIAFQKYLQQKKQ